MLPTYVNRMNNITQSPVGVIKKRQLSRKRAAYVYHGVKNVVSYSYNAVGAC